MDIKDITLTQDDFKLLDKALDFLPQKAFVSDLMSAMVAIVASKTPDDAHKRLGDIRKKSNPDDDMLKDDIRILQGKLLLLKRYLMQQGAMQEAEDILKK